MHESGSSRCMSLRLRCMAGQRGRRTSVRLTRSSPRFYLHLRVRDTLNIISLSFTKSQLLWKVHRTPTLMGTVSLVESNSDDVLADVEIPYCYCAVLTIFCHDSVKSLTFPSLYESKSGSQCIFPHCHHAHDMNNRKLL